MRATKLATAAIAVVAMAAFAAPASAGGGAKTIVTIQAESGGFFGFVDSPKLQKCASGRKVTLFKQLGHSQDPSSDDKIGSDIAQANGDGYMWSTGNTGSHSCMYYARAGKTSGCKAGTSETIRAQK
jgi:hypothetical protein